MPVKEHFEFLAGTRASGNYHYFTMNLFTGLEKNPFLADERMTDIFFGPTQDYEISGTVILPDGYKMDELPKNVKLIMPDTSIVFTRRSSFNQGILSVGITLQFRVPVYGVSDYDYFKEFYKKLFEFLNESFVYTKK
jgi:hypothetical protein